MIHATLVRQIERHADEIAEQVIYRVQRDPNVPNYQALSDDELRYRAQDLLRNMGHWLISQDETAIRDRYEDLGRTRRQQGFPLHEVVYKLQLLKLTVLGRVQDEMVATNGLQLFQQQDLWRRADLFFDRIIYAVVKGYSEAQLGVPVPKSTAGFEPLPMI
jgi:hypothetical protein